MSSEKPITKSAIEAVSKLYHLLEPLSPEERQRTIAAAMILFGESTPSQTPAPGKGISDPPHEVGEGICTKAALWMKKNAITREQLDHVFSIEDTSIDVIAAHMPEFGKKKQTLQAYVSSGLKSFLRTGDTSFTDADARDLCNKVGCYDPANHAAYTTAFGNLLTGSKSTGWKLTNPGLNVAAQIIKQLTPDAT